MEVKGCQPNEAGEPVALVELNRAELIMIWTGLQGIILKHDWNGAGMEPRFDVSDLPSSDEAYTLRRGIEGACRQVRNTEATPQGTAPVHRSSQ